MLFRSLLAQLPSPAMATLIGFVAFTGTFGAGRALHWARGPFISIMSVTPFSLTFLCETTSAPPSRAARSLAASID